MPEIALRDPIQGYVWTITGVAVHPVGTNPVFAEGRTLLEIEDEAGGPFLVLTQEPDTGKPQSIRLDFDELEAIVQAAALLRSQPATLSELKLSNERCGRDKT